MPWGRVDDTFHSHPKVTSIPAEIRMAAVGLHWMAISWCNAQTTDGKVPAHVIAALGGNDEQAAALVTAAQARDRDALDHLFGPASTEFVSGDKVEDEALHDVFGDAVPPVSATRTGSVTGSTR